MKDQVMPKTVTYMITISILLCTVNVYSQKFTKIKAEVTYSDYKKSEKRGLSQDYRYESLVAV